MAWVPDSRQAGYLGPNPEPRPDADDAYDNFLHDVIAGVTGLPNELVFPTWQTPDEPNLTAYGVDWAAFGVHDIKVIDFSPAVLHYDNGLSDNLGYDEIQDHQEDTIIVTFYGRNAGQYASFLRRGLYIDQNRAALRANAAALVDVTAIRKAPEKIRQQWWNRVDVEVILRREVRYHYNVRNLLRSVGTIAAAGGDMLHTGYDTAEVGPAPSQPPEPTIWDEGTTIWDGDTTTWDFASSALREAGGYALREGGGKELRE